jgi:hypothetical protein
MTAEQFVYWLQGYLEIDNPSNIPLNQTQIIKDHLKLVFKKETPVRDSNSISNPYNNNPTIINPFPTWQEPHVNPNPFTVTCTADPLKNGIIC